jgi:hypothetical protein
LERKYNVFKDNETTYSRKIYKIQELMKNGKFNCYKLEQNIYVICLEAKQIKEISFLKVKKMIF